LSKLVNIVNNQGQYKITIPKDIVEAKGWNSETKLRFVEDMEGNIALRVIESSSESDKRKRK
jgi:bifunctional DNA-binding transcriptional regulator/antitoxin component of YhaV-PrlF toxin-antitoxin module